METINDNIVVLTCIITVSHENTRTKLHVFYFKYFPKYIHYFCKKLVQKKNKLDLKMPKNYETFMATLPIH